MTTAASTPFDEEDRVENGQPLQQPQPGDLVPQNPPLLVPAEVWGPHTLERAEEKRKVMEGLKLLAIRSTSPQDWTKISGRPFLNDTGRMKFADIFGVSFKDLSVNHVQYNKEGIDVIHFYATVTACYQGRELVNSGSAATDDEIFCMRNQKGELVPKPLSEVNIGNVRKKAITNTMGRAVKSLLGLAFTWDEVEREFRAVGKNPDKIGGYSHADAASGGGGAKAASGKGVLNETKKELANMIFEMAGEDQEMAANMLAGYTEFKGRDGNMVPGKRSVKDLSDKQAEVTLRIVKKEYQQFQAEQLAGGNTPE